MYRHFCVAILLAFTHHLSRCQSVSTLMGARANGLGYASACLQDEWGLFNNVAGLSTLEHPSAFSTYDWQPSIPLGNRMAAGTPTT